MAAASGNGLGYSKGLFVGRVDHGGAPRVYSHVNHLQESAQYCADAGQYRHDIYGRLAHPDTLPSNGNMGCNRFSEAYNVQRRMAIEASQRPAMPFQRTPGGYDTLAKGRSAQIGGAMAGNAGGGGYMSVVAGAGPATQMRVAPARAPAQNVRPADLLIRPYNG